MKTLLFALWISAVSAVAATGDVISAAILPSGWAMDITIAGLATGGTYTNGFGSNNDPRTGTPRCTLNLSFPGYSGTVSGTNTQTIYGTKFLRVPYLTVSVPGTLNSGTFQEGETVTQASSGATGKILLSYGTGTTVFDVVLSVSSVVPDNSSQWTGGTSGATFTSTGAATTKTANAGLAYLQSCTGNSGTFQLNEAVTQATSGAAGVCKFAGAASGTIAFAFVLNPGSAPPNAANQWTGGTSGAKCTPLSGATAASSQSTYWAQEWSNGTNLVIRVALSERVYSGETVTLDIVSGFYTGSNAVTGLSVTNNSTGTAPTPILQWDEWAGVGAGDRVTGAFYMAANADVCGRGTVTAVKFTATGLTSGQVTTATVLALDQVAVVRPATGLYENCFRAQIPITGFTSGESIRLRAQAYSTVGTNVFDTDNFTTATEEVRLYNQATIVYNTTPKYAYVDVVGGNNANTGSTTLATAIANPIQHIGKAIQNDCTVIYLKAGQTHPVLGTVSATRRMTSEWYVVQPEDAGRVAVQLDASVRTQRCERLQFERCDFTMSAANAYTDGNADTVNNHMKFTNCSFVNGGSVTLGGTSAGIGYNNTSTRLYNCTGDLSHTSWRLGTFSTTRKVIVFDGCTFTESVTSASSIDTFHRVVACSTTGAVNWSAKSSANPSADQSRFFVHHNRCLRQTTSSGNWFNFNATSTAITEGFSLCGNVVEMSSTSVAMGLLGGDNSVAAVNKVSLKDNTFVGARWNAGYNDLGTSPSDRLDWSVRRNFFEHLASKHDTFIANAPNGNRVGGWPVLYGVGFSGNVLAHITGISSAGQFMLEFPGVSCYQPTLDGAQPPGGSTNAATFCAFVNRTPSTGGGDYRIKPTSPGLLLPITESRLSDFLGNREFQLATGAYSFLQNPVTSTGGTTVKSSGINSVRP